MANKKIKSPEEWFEQARYDKETAEAMFKAGRYMYTVFMCHLAIEKALKGHYAKTFEKNPPKTHDLNYLSEEIHLKLSPELQFFIDNINDLSVPTRYPDEIKKLLKQYGRDKTEAVLDQTKELFQWLKKNL